MSIGAGRSLVVAAATALALSGCGDSGDSQTDPCAEVTDQATTARTAAEQAIDDYSTYTEGYGLSADTPKGQKLGEDARLAVLTYLHLVANSPDCFSPTEVAKAESQVPGWEVPGSRPAMTASPPGL